MQREKKMWSGNGFTPSSSSSFGTQQNNQSAVYNSGNNILPLDQSSLSPLSAIFCPSSSTSFFHPRSSPDTGADDFLTRSSFPEKTFFDDYFNDIFNDLQTDSNIFNDLFDDHLVPALPTLPSIPDAVATCSTGGAATVEPRSVSPPTVAGATTALPLPQLPPAEKSNQFAANDALFPWMFPAVPLVAFGDVSADQPGASSGANLLLPIFHTPQTTDAASVRSRPSSLSVQLPNSRLVNSGIAVSPQTPVPGADQPSTSRASLLPPRFPPPPTTNAVSTGSRPSSLSFPNLRLVNGGITVSPPPPVPSADQPTISGASLPPPIFSPSPSSEAAATDSVPSSSVQRRNSRRWSRGGLTNAAPQRLLRPPEGQGLVALSLPSADETTTVPACKRKAASSTRGLELKSNGNIQSLILTAAPGEDISQKLMSAAKDEEALFILAATGDISRVQLLPAISSEIADFEGKFRILVLTGTLRRPKKGKPMGQLNISVAGQDGRLISGVLTGSLIAASHVQITGGTCTAKSFDELIKEQVQQAQVASMKVVDQWKAQMDDKMKRLRQEMQAQIDERRRQLQTTNQRLETALEDLILTRQQLTATQNMVLELSQRTNAQPLSRSAVHRFTTSSNLFTWSYRP